MADERVVPVLPTANLRETLAFYSVLGFETLYQQHAPYAYGSVGLGGIQLDFYGNKALPPQQETGHICLVVVPDVDALHTQFSSNIKKAYGKQLRSGIPRLNSVNTLSKDRRFNLIDPAGNRLTVIQVRPPTHARPVRGTPLTRAMVGAKLDAYSRDEPSIAAEHLDRALERAATETPELRFQASVLRADIAAMLADSSTLEHCVQNAKALALEDHAAPGLAEARQRLSELEDLR